MNLDIQVAISLEHFRNRHRPETKLPKPSLEAIVDIF